MKEKKNGLKRLTDKILIDTDILIDAARNVETAKNKLEELNKSSVICISVITQMEMLVGCENKREQKIVEKYLNNFIIIPVTDIISTKAYELLKKYRLSHGLLIPDSLIAATSISEEISLITKNQKDYKFITDLKLLKYP